MKCIVLFVPSLGEEHDSTFKHLEQGMCVSLDPSQVSNLFKSLNLSLKLPFNSPDCKKAVEEGFGVGSAQAAERRIHREKTEECASKGSDGLAGEVLSPVGTKQHVSAVQKEKSKTCNGSSPSAAAGAGAQCIGSTTTKTQSAVSPGSELERRSESECAPKRSDESSAGAASTVGGAKQQIGVVGHGSKALHIPKTKEAEDAGSRFVCLFVSF